MKLLSILLVGMMLIIDAQAEPLLTRTDVFSAGEEGYALYRVPGMVVTSRGSVLAYCEARRTGKSDWDTIDILLRRSTDGGKSWSARQKIADIPGPKTKNPAIANYKLAAPSDVTYNNAVAITGGDGVVHFLFCLEYMRCFYLRSDDDGITWSTPVEITSSFEALRPTYDWKVLATGPGHGIALQNGRLLVPIWLSTSTGGGNGHRPSISATLYSDDQGKTWRTSQIAVSNIDAWVNPSEGVAVELADGRVMLNVRNEGKANRRLVTISADGSTGWSEPRFDEALLEPICMGSIARVSRKPASSRNRIVFANPDNLLRADGRNNPGEARDRKNLSVKLSYDEGETWPATNVLEAGYSCYSDLAVLPGGTILCFYERGSTTGKSGSLPQHLTLARFNVEWLTQGKDKGE